MIKKAYFEKGPEFAANELAEQILQWTSGTGAKGGVVGLSGGIDSTTVAYLCKFAFNKYNANNTDKLELHGLALPSKANDKKDEGDGLGVAKELGIEAKVVEIEPIADMFKEQMPESFQTDLDKGNLYSETRAVVLSRYAGANNLRVMGTGNRDEDYILGYFTKRGDGAVDNNILGELPKRLVRDLATWLGVPAERVNRVSTAGLWAGQTDEKELGYGYDKAEMIQNGFDQGLSVKEIRDATGYEQKIVEDVAYRHKTTEHKRNLPPVGKVSIKYE